MMPNEAIRKEPMGQKMPLGSWLVMAVIALLLSPYHVGAQIIDTVAGQAGEGGSATSAPLSTQLYTAVDADFNAYVSDRDHHRIRKITAAGVITTVAGSGAQGYFGDGGAATSASLSNPGGITLDTAGNLYISDTTNQRVRRVDAATGVISTVAGTGASSFSGDGGPATSAALQHPNGLALDSAGNLYVVDSGNHRVRKIDAVSGVISTFAGDGASGYSGDGGAATSASFSFPNSVALDNSGNVYISDIGNHRIRRIDATSGVVTTVAGIGTSGFSGDGGAATAASLSSPAGLALDSTSNLYIADLNNGRIRKISASNGLISTVMAALSSPTGLAMSSGYLYIGERFRVRRFHPTTSVSGILAGNGTQSFSGDGGPALAASFFNPAAVAIDATGNLYIADKNNQRVRKIDGVSGVISSYAGNGTFGFSGDNGSASNATFKNVAGIAIDSSGNLYIADEHNYRIRKVAAGTGTITTVAGTGTRGYSGDGGMATSANLSDPSGLALDGGGNLYISDYGNNRIRKVDTSGVITTVAGNGSGGFSGDGGAATSAMLSDPRGIAIDASGSLLIADRGNRRVRRVAIDTGKISTVAGSGVGFSGDGGLATNAGLTGPTAVAVDAAANLYVSDGGDVNSNPRIRKIYAASGIIVTIAGSASVAFAGDGGPAASAILHSPQGLAFDSAGNLYFADQGSQRIRKLTNTAPAAPTITGVAAGSGQVMVSFTAGSDGGSSITGFTVTSAPGAFTATGTSSPITVTGLANCNAYTFTVTATNSVGTSASSTASGSTTPNSAPTANAGPDFETTVGSSLPLDGSASTDPDLACGDSLSYAWDITSDGVFDATGSNPTLTPQQFAAAGVTAAGAYTLTLRVMDSFGGVATDTATYLVFGPPNAPRSVSASPGNTRATVSFLPPLSDGGKTITSYTVSSSPSGITATGSASPIIVTGLGNGTAYTFTVAATNSVGTGPASTPSNSVTPILVSPDTAISSNPGALSTASATFSFTGSVGNGGPIASFECMLDVAPFFPCTSSHSLSGLTDGSHTFKVRAIDAGANADPTPASHTWTVDATPPVLAFDPPLPITAANQASYTVSGVCSEAGRNVTIAAGSVNATVSCGGGGFTSSLDVTSLPDGPVALSAATTDAAGNNAAANATVAKNTAPHEPAQSDFNADGKSDMLWRNASTGNVYRMLMNGTTILHGAFVWAEPNLDWTLVADADFNGDGISDLLWRNSSTGQVFMALFGPSGSAVNSAFVYTEPNAAWKIVHTPDLDGDGRADILWWNSTTGQVYAMLMNGFGIVAQGHVYTEPNTAWKIVTVGDFVDSGKRNQLLWRNSTTGQVTLMTVSYASGAFATTAPAPIYQEPNTAWKIIAGADFNGDGKTDILWRNESTGRVYAMLMNGTAIASQGTVYFEPNLAWKIVAAGDYNGDGKADLLWRNDSTGQVYMVLMNGLAIASQAMVYQEGNLDWKLLGGWEYGQATGIFGP